MENKNEKLKSMKVKMELHIINPQFFRNIDKCQNIHQLLKTILDTKIL